MAHPVSFLERRIPLEPTEWNNVFLGERSHDPKRGVCSWAWTFTCFALDMSAPVMAITLFTNQFSPSYLWRF